MPHWPDVRDSVMKHPEVTYLNAGSISITPRAVYEQAVQLREKMHGNPVDYVWRTSAAPLWKARSRLAQFVGTTPERLILAQNVSQAINFVASSIKLPENSEILTTDHEYLAMRWAWDRAAERLNIPLRIMKLPVHSQDPDQLTQAVIDAFSPETSLLFISHILYTTGLILPIRSICQEARRRRILTVIDGAHGPGMIPLSLDEMGADFYATNLHKWFMAPNGSGFLYVAPGREPLIAPWQVSWGWKYDRDKAHEQGEYGCTYWQRSFEFEGTRDITPWLTLGTGVDFLDNLGAEVIRNRHHELSTLVRRLFDGLEGLTLITPNHAELRGGLTAFRMPANVDGHKARKYLWENYKIEINMVEHPDGPFFRLSTHIYNLPEEIQKLASLVPEAFAHARRH
ncbi:MAG: aminotransferase class V-fold PLP-dependent enzyme [Planctomycetia bacterium]|nr:aminotransferase class V-fold PLP-dependent enzyme [Planctomycetia bacterium]